jgi:uncharacterized LabA/DUF88 family protein
MFYKNERLAVVIDGNSTIKAANVAGYSMDWKKLRDHLMGCGVLHSMAFVVGVKPLGGPEHNSMRPLIDFLATNGYRLVTREGREVEGDDGRVFLRDARIHVEFTMTAIRAAEDADHVVLMTGDGSYAPLIPDLHRRGARVTLFSNYDTMAHHLLRAADSFVDLADMEGVLAMRARADA